MAHQPVCECPAQHDPGPDPGRPGEAVVDLTDGHALTLACAAGVRGQVYRGARLIKVADTGGVYGRAEGEEIGTLELSLDELVDLVTRGGLTPLEAIAAATSTNARALVSTRTSDG